MVFLRVDFNIEREWPTSMSDRPISGNGPLSIAIPFLLF